MISLCFFFFTFLLLKVVVLKASGWFPLIGSHFCEHSPVVQGNLYYLGTLAANHYHYHAITSFLCPFLRFGDSWWMENKERVISSHLIPSLLERKRKRKMEIFFLGPSPIIIIKLYLHLNHTTNRIIMVLWLMH